MMPPCVSRNFKDTLCINSYFKLTAYIFEQQLLLRVAVDKLLVCSDEVCLSVP